MKSVQRITAVFITLVVVAGCSNMSRQDKNTATGAGVGGAILTGGSAAGTVGGAAVGAVIGHEVDK